MANSFTPEAPAKQAETKPPMLADAGRDDGRDQLRDPVRIRPREPHQKYYISPNDPRLKNQSATFVATKVRGAPSPRLGEYIRSGYRPARAEDWPEFSDYGLFDQTLIDMGIVPDIKPDSPVVRDDLMLVTRPKNMTDKAMEEDKVRAESQHNDHMRRIRERSRHAIGDRTKIERYYGPNDIVPEEMEGMESRR